MDSSGAGRNEGQGSGMSRVVLQLPLSVQTVCRAVLHCPDRSPVQQAIMAFITAVGLALLELSGIRVGPHRVCTPVLRGFGVCGSVLWLVAPYMACRQPGQGCAAKHSCVPKGVILEVTCMYAAILPAWYCSTSCGVWQVPAIMCGSMYTSCLVDGLCCGTRTTAAPSCAMWPLQLPLGDHTAAHAAAAPGVRH